MIDSWQTFPETAFFVRHTLAQVTCVFVVVIALLQLGLFLNNRNDTQYGWTVVAVVGYAIVSFSFFFAGATPRLADRLAACAVFRHSGVCHGGLHLFSK